MTRKKVSRRQSEEKFNYDEMDYSKLDYSQITDEEFNALWSTCDPSAVEYIDLGPPVGKEIIDDECD